MEQGKTNKSSHIILTFLCIITFLVSFNVATSNIKAEDEKGKIYNWFSLDNLDPVQNYKEWQFITKINIIKTVFGDRIYEPALIATVMHQFGASQIINDAYDEEFDEDGFKNIFNQLSKISEIGVATPHDNKNRQIDLLNAATLVMLDSNGGGPYNAEKYQEALTKDKLVGTDDALGTAFNAAVCASGAAFDFITTGFQFVGGLVMGDTPIDTIKSKFTRYNDMTNICNNGYIGGLYGDVLEMEDGDAKKAKKEQIAKEIMADVDTYKELFGLSQDKCLYNTSSYTGDATNWRQAGSSWSSITLGAGGQSVANSGCTATSMSYLIKKSGTKLTVDNFDPGVFVQNTKYTSSMLIWNSWTGIAPHFIMEQANLTVSGDPAAVFSKQVSEAASGGYQRFIIIEVPGHWVAFDHVENGQVYVMDPAAPEGTGLIPLTDVTNSRGPIQHYNTFYATDVPFGGSGSSSNNNSGSNGSSNNECDTTGSGELTIPEEYGNGGYTITEYDRFNWVYDQGRMYEKWSGAGSHFTDGIATYEDRYLIACTETFGKVGDKVDFFLDDGTKIPSVIADIKSSGDAGYNKWGHNNGQNVIEFEVASSYYHKYGNPGSGNGWYDQWHGKRVASASNLGSVF